MALLPIAEAVSGNDLTKVNLLASDFDGTLTYQGKLTASVLKALEALAAAPIPVLIITGRSAGWVEAMNSYLPVTGAIAENGGVFYSQKTETLELLTPIVDLHEHRNSLKQTFQLLKTHFPHLKESADNQFRITDWTFDVQGLSLSDLQKLTHLCEQWGWDFTYSTVQCHIKPLQQSKAASLLWVIQKYFPHCKTEQVLTIGDSPNDESLFNPQIFPLSVGVRNILDYSNQLNYYPKYVTTKVENEGFCELVDLIVNNAAN